METATEDRHMKLNMAKSHFLRWHYEDLLAAMENHIRGVCPLGCVDRDALAWAIQVLGGVERAKLHVAARAADEAGGHGEAVAPGWYP
jgi:hypothetical protein